MNRRDQIDSSLDDAERALFNEALARGEALRKTTEEAIVEYGHWLFVQVFGGDSSAALDHRDDNALWNLILAAADGPRLRIDPAAIERTVLCAAYDKRLNSDGWRMLDYSRKSRLVRLANDKLLRKGAQHVLATNMTTAATEKYVREVLRAEGEPVQTRVTLGRVATQLERFTERFSDAAFVERLGAVVASADDAARRAAIEQLDAAQKTLAALRAKLSPKGKPPAHKRKPAAKRKR